MNNHPDPSSMLKVDGTVQKTVSVACGCDVMQQAELKFSCEIL